MVLGPRRFASVDSVHRIPGSVRTEVGELVVGERVDPGNNALQHHMSRQQVH